MESHRRTRAHFEIKARDHHGVNFPDRCLKVTMDGISPQGRQSLVLVSDAGHHPFALLEAVDALVSRFGQAALDDHGIAVPESFFTKRKDSSGWHRDEVLSALAQLEITLGRSSADGLAAADSPE